jgi:beta-lactamase regulating signal transducer with metallopeptidase domain
MLHFLWLGTGVGLLAAVTRRALSPAPPNVRYLVALGWLAVVSIVPLGLFAQAITSARNMTRRAMPAAEWESADSKEPHAPSSATFDRHGDEHPIHVQDRWFHSLRLQVLRASWAACHWLPWAWVVGTPLSFVGLTMAVGGAHRLRRESQLLVTGQAAETCRRLRGALRISERVGVAVCRRACTPLVVGIVRPLILLPPALLADCSPEQIEMVILHELAHVGRCDNLVNLAQRMIEALLFFHPSVWWISSWVRLEREHCCDAIVLAHLGRPQSYAETLAGLALPRSTLRGVAAAMADRHLIVRIRHILNLEDTSMKLSKTWLSLSAAALVAAAYCAVHAGAAADDEQPNASNPHARLARMLQDQRRAYGAEQATGAPDTLTPGDHETAWAPQTQPSRSEWLDLSYAEPVEAIAVMVYETLRPDPLIAMDVYDGEGNVTPISIGKAREPERDKNVAFIQFPRSFKTQRVRLHFKPAVANEPTFQIDAVGLLDAGGNTHWAKAANASSTYADVAGGEAGAAWNVAQPSDTWQQNSGWSNVGAGAFRLLGPSGDVVEFDFDRVTRLEKELQELRLEIECLKRAQRLPAKHSN